MQLLLLDFKTFVLAPDQKTGCKWIENETRVLHGTSRDSFFSKNVDFITVTYRK